MGLLHSLGNKSPHWRPVRNKHRDAVQLFGNLDLARQARRSGRVEVSLSLSNEDPQQKTKTNQKQQSKITQRKKDNLVQVFISSWQFGTTPDKRRQGSYELERGIRQAQGSQIWTACSLSPAGIAPEKKLGSVLATSPTAEGPKTQDSRRFLALKKQAITFPLACENQLMSCTTY